MKILVFSQRYWPEPFRITDTCEELVKRGHEVTVITGLPMYPGGYIFDDYKKRKNIIEEHNGVKIIRVNEAERRKNVFHRILNYYSYPILCKKLLKNFDSSYDVVLVNELSPIMVVKPALYYKKKYNKKVVMYEMDLWPESLLAGGISNSSFIYKHYKKVSSKLYSNCDKILVSTKEHIPYIRALKNCDDLDIEYLSQYAEEQFLFVKSEDFVDGNTINLMFAGNIGKAQSVETILKAASLLEKENVHFHIVGDGAEYQKMVSISEELRLKNVTFYGEKPLTSMIEFYSGAQAMLVTLENKSYANMTIPGKIQSYMASGKPIIGSISGSGYNFIKNNDIGLVCESGDYKALAKIIKSLDSEKINYYGKKAREVYLKKYSRDNFISKLIDHLKLNS